MTDHKRHLWIIWIGIIVFCMLTVLISLSVGQYTIPFSHVIHDIFYSSGSALTVEEQAVLWDIRMPRTLVGFLVGAGLAVSGAIMQAVFINPLADPAILGVSSGASLGAVIAISSGGAAAGFIYIPAFAMIGAVAAVGLTLLLSWKHGKVRVMTLLLAGIVVGMMCSALISGILMISTNQQLHQYLFWTIGGLDYRRWEHVQLAVGPITAGIIVAVFLARHLNILILGGTEARALGMRVILCRLLFLAIASLMTAFSVCVSGNIGFVGLAVPHMMRLIVGADHRNLIPAAAVAGGIFLVLCDTLGRVLFPVMEIRVGIVTALLGTPYFLYLLRHKQK
ncbi:FecCD family ABC transporter permease [Megasphaera cerevisiae]|uniref:FecCD family ABC transporter permease n=1 Tax=Megasphaera cerevisiae TaxID=39029 RepID=UPI00094397E3|nr:iron ABC transporter permease [Megasphaera cerevisiae]OKY52953.1 iron ABC transporter [Megasphaera cerevisiae]